MMKKATSVTLLSSYSKIGESDGYKLDTMHKLKPLPVTGRGKKNHLLANDSSCIGIIKL